jgi:hypothetical protein
MIWWHKVLLLFAGLFAAYGLVETIEMANRQKRQLWTSANDLKGDIAIFGFIVMLLLGIVWLS